MKTLNFIGQYLNTKVAALKGFRVFGTTELRNDIRKLMVL